MSCDPCGSPVVTNLPGPQGDPGADGIDGLDGANAFTTVTVQGLVPVAGANVTLDVADSTWAALGQNVYIDFVGDYEVMAKPSDTTITLKNLKGIAAYQWNLDPPAVIAVGYRIAPSGKQGIAGTAPTGAAPDNSTYVVQVADPALPNAVAFASALPAGGLVKTVAVTGIPTVAIDGADYLSPATGLEPADIGVTVQARNANLDALAGLAGAADRIGYFTGASAMLLAILTSFGRQLIAAASASAARTLLGTRYGLLGSGTGLLLNSAPATDLVSIAINSTRYIVDRVIATDASISLTAATLGLFGSAGGGVPAVCADQALSALTDSTKWKALTISAAGSTDILTAATLVPRLGTPQGAAATCNLWVFGYDLS